MPSRHVGGKVMRKSIVWTTIPPISWLLPFIGHLGITDSEGKVHDFGASFFINIGSKTVFGPVLRFVPLPIPDTDECNDMWDQSIAQADEKYRQLAHNIISLNCHDHVSECIFNYVTKARMKLSKSQSTCNNAESENILEANTDFGYWLKYLPTKEKGNAYYASWMFFYGKYSNLSAFYYHWMPFFTIILIVGLVCWFADI